MQYKLYNLSPVFSEYEGKIIKLKKVTELSEDEFLDKSPRVNEVTKIGWTGEIGEEGEIYVKVERKEPQICEPIHTYNIELQDCGQEEQKITLICLVLSFFTSSAIITESSRYATQYNITSMYNFVYKNDALQNCKKIIKLIDDLLENLEGKDYEKFFNLLRSYLFLSTGGDVENIKHYVEIIDILCYMHGIPNKIIAQTKVFRDILVLKNDMINMVQNKYPDYNLENTLLDSVININNMPSISKKVYDILQKVSYEFSVKNNSSKLDIKCINSKIHKSIQKIRSENIHRGYVNDSDEKQLLLYEYARYHSILLILKLLYKKVDSVRFNYDEQILEEEIYKRLKKFNKE